jgi:hypothetical protein
MLDLDYTAIKVAGAHHQHVHNNNNSSYNNQRCNGSSYSRSYSSNQSARGSAKSSPQSAASAQSTTNNTSNNTESKVNKQINYSRYKTEMCRQYSENGECKYGEKCQFAHGAAELKDVSRHPKYKTDLCKTFHSKGFCPYGPRCHFIHDIAEYQQELAAAARVHHSANTIDLNNNNASNATNNLLRKIKTLKLEDTGSKNKPLNSYMIDFSTNNLTANLNGSVLSAAATNSPSLSSSQSPSPNSFIHLAGGQGNQIGSTSNHINNNSTSSSSSSRSSSSSISSASSSPSQINSMLASAPTSLVDSSTAMLLMANVFASPSTNVNDVLLGFYAPNSALMPSSVGSSSSSTSSDDELQMLSSNFNGLINASHQSVPSLFIK